MKVYRIKHKPSGLFIYNSQAGYANKFGRVYFQKCFNFDKYNSDSDYEILYDELKD